MKFPFIRERNKLEGDKNSKIESLSRGRERRDWHLEVWERERERGRYEYYFRNKTMSGVLQRLLSLYLSSHFLPTKHNCLSWFPRLPPTTP